MKGVTMKQFAEMNGTTRQNIHSVVVGRTRSAKYRAKIAEFLGRPVNEVFPE